MATEGVIRGESYHPPRLATTSLGGGVAWNLKAVDLLLDGQAEGVVRVEYCGVPCQVRIDWLHPLRGNAMSDAYVRRLLKRLAAKAGIDKRVHAHGLRHTHAAQLRAEGVDIAIISRQLGHAAPRAVIETMRNRIWPGV